MLINSPSRISYPLSLTFLSHGFPSSLSNIRRFTTFRARNIASIITTYSHQDHHSFSNGRNEFPIHTDSSFSNPLYHQAHHKENASHFYFFETLHNQYQRYKRHQHNRLHSGTSYLTTVSIIRIVVYLSHCKHSSYLKRNTAGFVDPSDLLSTSWWHCNY